MTAEEKLLELVSARWQAGREIACQYRKRHRASISYGALYVAMRQLCEQGVVESKDEIDRDGRVRLFKLAGGKRVSEPVAGAPAMA